MFEEPPVKRKRGRPPKPKHHPQQIATKVRAAFYNGLMEVCARENKAMHEIMADWIQSDPKGTFAMVSQFFPKEQKFDVGENLGAYLLRLEREQRNPKVIEHDTTKHIEKDPSET